MGQFKKLFEPGYIGKMKVKNRIIQAPLHTHQGSRDGSVTPRMLDYYRERARGNTGLIIVEYAYVDDIMSQSYVCQLAAYDTSFVPGLSTLARVIKDNGARACMQINHGGRQRFLGGASPRVAPSPVPWGASGQIIPHELTIEEIQEITKAFGRAAGIAEQSGFDIVEIHGAHSYLIAEFRSPRTNRRTDIYGGDSKGRMRFALEVVASVRKNVSQDFPVGIRINGSEHMAGGVTIEDSIEFARELEKAGVNVIHVSAGSRDRNSTTVVPSLRPLAYNVPLAEAIKKAVHIPVIASGSITNPQLAEDILEEGKADFVSMARPLLADPWFARKAEEGRPEDIAPCIRCNEGCLVRGAEMSRTVSCTVNVSVGFERELTLEPAVKSKIIAVIGGGPGGMEAARVATLRGHSVTLYDERDQLGGYLLEASVPAFKKDLASLKDYLSTQVKKSGVKVILGQKATVDMIQKQGFDFVILATGSTSLIPPIPGAARPSVVTALDVLRGKPVGQNVVMLGGGLVSCEVALFLAQAGKKIRIVVRRDNVAMGVEGRTREVLLEEFPKYGVQASTGLQVQEVGEGFILATDKSGRSHKLEADSVVLAMGFVPRNDLLEELEKANIPVCAAGDCVKPRKIYDAIHEGFLAAYRL